MYKKLIIATACIAALVGCVKTIKHPKPKQQNPQSTNTNQMLPPKYLSIEGFKSCLSSQTKDSASFYCMPSKKPQRCSDKAWEQLNNLEKSEKIPNCKN